MGRPLVAEAAAVADARGASAGDADFAGSRIMDGIAENYVEVNGLPCRVWEKGEGKKLFYLAGVAGLPRWTRFLDRLAETRRVVAPSLPGYPGAEGHDLLDSHLDWIVAALDLLAAAGADGGEDPI